MLRFTVALVFLALTALLAPNATAHTRSRIGSSPARAPGDGLRRGATAISHGGRGRELAAAARPLRPADGRQSRRRLASTEQARSRRDSHARQVPQPPDLLRGRHNQTGRARSHMVRSHLLRTRDTPLRPARAYASRRSRQPETGRSAAPGTILNAAGQRQPSQWQPGQRPGDAGQPRPTDPAVPVPVVSVIRPNTVHPQLESVNDAVTEPFVLPQLPNDRGRRAVPAPLYGSHEILVHQNQMADRDGLDRILNDDDLLDKRRERQLVPLPESLALHIDERLPANRRFCRPWVAQFLAAMAYAHYARFHTPLQVNSAVRTVEFQHHLIHTNGNAAPAEGDTASPHLTGQAVDIAKRWMPLTEIAWMRGYLLPQIEGGRIDVEEEFQQACFHISAYRSAAPLPPIGSPGRYMAETPGIGQNSLAPLSSAR